jgi:hypothetical protein
VKRCHLCGREGSRDYLSARAAILPTMPEAPALRAAQGEAVRVTICRYRVACQRRRGLRP